MPQSRFHHLLFLQPILILLLIGIAAISLTFSIQSFQTVEKTIRTSSFKAFNNSIEASYDIVDTALNESIKRYLRGIVTTSAKFITQIQTSSFLTQKQKNTLIQNYINSNKIGDTGYPYILNSKGQLVYHPIFQGRNVSEYRHIQEQIDNDDHFVEYLWINPGEEKPRRKLAYSIYVEELDFVISASAYKDELLHFIDKTILKDKLNKYQYGKTGYVYVIDLVGELILHPSYEGENIRSLIGENADGLLKKIQQSAHSYSLQMNLVNGSPETVFHSANVEDYSYQITIDNNTYQKDVLYIYYPYLDWAIVSGISRDELHRPTNTLLYSLLTLVLSLTAIIVILLLLLNHRHKKLVNVLNRDYLTGLFNRRAFHYMASKLTKDTQHPTGFKPYSIILLDIDFFKRINDTYGHTVGDKIIAIVGKAISQYPNILAARYGGEEFVLFTKESDPKQAVRFTEQVRKKIDQYNTLHEKVTLSAGITTINKPNVLLDDVIEQADKALYHSKNTGRNKITHYREL
ncbi:diguanylate cyclase [Aliivibrio sp. S4TY2]|uniref:diguanylate cyclase n=1 Tax=unclassified Aliivibrio TaxID=2645654 RepID=UPI0023789264|nr:MULTISPECIES: diguanylate cyclase [unclassified Aliivibrio]MDD9157050.1 diguanylate cyclase [Aliivibrio sp. S4TY2]MDD9160736.1 diguanylate cyclase [Aliivibrio sp. S4TY1]MDD9164765.1 diguanylate cyclase [Aliivibrio sp. S4MY2]MDD9168960.1 diguanylate cyclase [Aliivibrio sp. S4MY4]MDD9185488.1 diguanylate cyclase [Aliivibrio sp. S4MY3]